MTFTEMNRIYEDEQFNRYSQEIEEAEDEEEKMYTKDERDEAEQCEREELVGKLGKLAQDYEALHSQHCITSVYDNSVQVPEEFYRATWPNYRTHKMENAGSFIRISHAEGAVEFFSLFEIKARNIADLI